MTDNVDERIGWMELSTLPMDRVAAPSGGAPIAILGASNAQLMEQLGWIVPGATQLLLADDYSETTAVASTLAAFAPGHLSVADLGDPSDVARSFVALRAAIETTLAKCRVAGGILIDGTAMGKTVLSALVGMLIQSRGVPSIDILYRKMAYSYNGEPLEKVFVGDGGRHEINEIAFGMAAVPYVEGHYSSSRRRHLILLAGLDYQRVLARIRELEAASLDIIIEEEALAEAKSAELFGSICQLLEIDAGNVIIVARTDLRGTVYAIRDAITRGKALGHQSILVSAGGKPFSLAATLQSVLESEIPMLSTIPDRVVALGQQPDGELVVYRLSDPTALP